MKKEKTRLKDICQTTQIRYQSVLQVVTQHPIYRSSQDSTKCESLLLPNVCELQSSFWRIKGKRRGGHSRGVSRNDTAHPRSSRPSSAAVTKTKSPLKGNPIQILFAREEKKVKQTNPQKDLKFWLTWATPKDIPLGARDRHKGGMPHRPAYALVTPPHPTHVPQHPSELRHNSSHVTSERSQACEVIPEPPSHR